MMMIPALRMIRRSSKFGIHQTILSSSQRQRYFSSLDFDNSVIVTRSCAKQIQTLKNKLHNPNLHLRVSVEGGGCSGFKYTFQMEDSDIMGDDRTFEVDGCKVVIDGSSFDMIKGSTVDYVQEMVRSSFAVLNNPLSESACGCGSSFAVKNFASNPALD